MAKPMVKLSMPILRCFLRFFCMSATMKVPPVLGMLGSSSSSSSSSGSSSSSRPRANWGLIQNVSNRGIWRRKKDLRWETPRRFLSRKARKGSTVQGNSNDYNQTFFHFFGKITAWGTVMFYFLFLLFILPHYEYQLCEFLLCFCFSFRV